MGRAIWLSEKESRRVYIMERVVSGQLTTKQGPQLSGARVRFVGARALGCGPRLVGHNDLRHPGEILYGQGVGGDPARQGLVLQDLRLGVAGATEDRDEDGSFAEFRQTRGRRS
jgi:hypothetical protein